MVSRVFVMFLPMAIKAYPRPTGRFVRRPKRMLERPATAAVAMTRSSLSSSLLSVNQIR